jgi:hypothetical protein
MVVTMAAVMMATTETSVAAKTMAARAVAGGTDSNQLKVAAEETVAAVAATMATELAPVTVSKHMPMPTFGNQQQ